MVYFLDFDRTIFDTDAFTTHLLATRGATLPHDIGEEKLRATLSSFLECEEASFAPGELAPFVYQDVPEFLRAAGNEAVILTFGNPALQKLKVGNALAGIPRVSALYTDDRYKGTFLKERIHLYGGSLLFVDDSSTQLENMERECPSVRLFEMRRDGEAGDGRWPVIRSFSELP